MALYKRSGVSMWGGCLPMLLQMPIFIALFRFFPSSIELRQESFLWADDLSAYDSILDLPFNIPLYGDHVSLFCLLMAFTMYVSTKISMSQQPQNAQFKGMSTMMLYVMPIMMLLIFNNYSSGLSYYYFLSSLITILQTLIIRRFFVNEEEILRKMNERVAKKTVIDSKKPKKKSFMERLEEKAREQQRQQQKQIWERNKKKKK
jgi:YidC/Oxa1 family membrane protein insertase